MLTKISSKLKDRKKSVIADWELKPSSVLVPIYRKEHELYILFTKRTSHLRSHPGQISFPGGKYDSKDGTLLETALREAEEEIGLRREDIEILGELDDMITSTQYKITPFVCTFPYPYDFRVNTQEIDEILEVPVCALSDPAIREERFHNFLDRYKVKVYYYHIGPEPVWGATAHIVKNLLDLLN